MINCVLRIELLTGLATANQKVSNIYGVKKSTNVGRTIKGIVDF